MRNSKDSSFKLTTLLVVLPLISLFLYGLLTHIFFFYSQNQESKRELYKYEKTLMEAEKNQLKEKVENLAQFIHYYDSKSSDKIKKDAKNIVDLMVNVANNIYINNQGMIEDSVLKKMVINALSNIKFEGDLGYLFLLDIKGNAYIHVDPKIMGHNIMDIQDSNGKYIVREFTKVIQTKGEGFVDYYWYIVTEDRKIMYYKISYIKKLDCFDWYVGAGEYLKYMKRYVRDDLLLYIKDNHQFHKGYFFVSNSHNDIIYLPKEMNKIKANINQYRREGFYEDSKQIAYTEYIAEYDWYITAVKELDGIRLGIQKKKEESQMKREENIQTNLYLMLFTWIISLLLSLYLSFIMHRMLKKYEKQLQSTNEKLVFQSRQALLGELLPMIAHQWRQPINKIASILALLRFGDTKKFTPKQLDNHYQDMENNVEFMSETIDDFRTFYQPKEYTTQENLKLLILRSIEFLEGAIRKKDIQLSLNLENITHTLYANEFLQVMINLIKNAVDVLEIRGKIEISLYQNEYEVIVEVKDNGKGISNEKINKIFEPYFTTKKDSMGLGLYMSKIIIEKHMNGKLEAENLTVGGVCFRITFYLNK